MRGCGIFVATRSQQTRLVGCGGRLFLVIPLGFKPKTFRTFSDLIRLNEKREKPFWALPFPRDPVGIQTQDLQNRNLTLYSAKLRDRGFCYGEGSVGSTPEMRREVTNFLFLNKVSGVF